jgi:taurine dioxygenase
MRPNFLLFEHRTKPEFTRRFNWRVGSLARASQPVNDYNGFRRVMHRVTLAGDRPH